MILAERPGEPEDGLLPGRSPAAGPAWLELFRNTRIALTAETVADADADADAEDRSTGSAR